MKPEDYVEELGAIAKARLCDDLARQIFPGSNVATNKYKVYRRAWQAILLEASLFIRDFPLESISR